MGKGGLNLPIYVSLLKNLRAIAFFNPKSPLPQNEVNWLKRKFKYRNIGISKGFLKAVKPEVKSIFSKQPFRIVEPPIVEINDFIEIVSELNTKVPDYVVESIILASCYVNPIIVVGRESFQILSQFAVWNLKSTAELPDIEIKRNFRIIGYAILDFHEKVITKTYKVLKEVAEKVKSGEIADDVTSVIEEILDERRKMAQKDGEKRFWRLRQTGRREERIVIAYLDILPMISKMLTQRQHIKLADFIAGSTVNLSMALSLVPTFILQLET